MMLLISDAAYASAAMLAALIPRHAAAAISLPSRCHVISSRISYAADGYAMSTLLALTPRSFHDPFRVIATLRPAHAASIFMLCL